MSRQSVEWGTGPLEPTSARATDATLDDLSRDAGGMFQRAEHAGLKLAIIGRIIALVLLGLWLVGTRARDPSRALEYLLLLAVFAGLGLAHYFLIGTRLDRSWIKYVFISMDIAIVSVLVATQPLFDTAADLPPVMMFRAPVFPFYFVILGIAAFSFSPRLVLWTGIGGAVGWLVAFLHAAGGVDGSLNWRAIPPTRRRMRSWRSCSTPTLAGSAHGFRRRSCLRSWHS